MKLQFARYVSQNILGMLGFSFYILADTYFISRAEGADGIAALNLVLPLFSLINAIGAMIGVGSAICYCIRRAMRDREADLFFSNAVFWVLVVSIPFLIGGAFFPAPILAFMGGDETILNVGTSYTRIVLLFTPAFMCNTTVNAFVRNDDDPSLAMASTLLSSVLNVVLDYVLMFPLGLGLTGAALATGVSPVSGILICCVHFFKKTNTLVFLRQMPSVRLLYRACMLGIAAFIGELSSGVTTAVFNRLILVHAGNTGVAAYGVIANTALVATALFNGIAQGAQPLISEAYGYCDREEANAVLKLSFLTAASAATLIIAGIYLFTDPIVSFFNSEGSVMMAEYAFTGIRMYFLGFLFAGLNIAGCGYLSATEQAKSAFICSISRGLVSIVICAVILGNLFGLPGIWMAFADSEMLTFVFMVILMVRHKSAWLVRE